MFKTPLARSGDRRIGPHQAKHLYSDETDLYEVCMFRNAPMQCSILHLSVAKIEGLHLTKPNIFIATGSTSLYEVCMFRAAPLQISTLFLPAVEIEGLHLTKPNVYIATKPTSLYEVCMFRAAPSQVSTVHWPVARQCTSPSQTLTCT